MSTNTNPLYLEFYSSLNHLKERLHDIDPELPNHMRTIHANLRNYDELAHLLSLDEIRTIIQGLKKHTGTELVKATAKKPKAKAAKFDLEEL
jgi:hypothetical protein